ncbi:GNAT family N-acetyltransferase [Roseiconus lacunae]|uniref:GNAT family N-acetyltransferase n=1 Tax=Roseiconus lacunae TaxID=2605694 RepID=UPI001E64334A|nr:GNAT family N-acetyltransferase [Roseiconus lacunae]MCD0457918.1 GNAT family N-acetyltransferase [Roseiconus lacunae]
MAHQLAVQNHRAFDGLFVAKEGKRVVGSIWVQPWAGTDMLIWPPASVGCRRQRTINELILKAEQWGTSRNPHRLLTYVNARQFSLLPSLYRRGFRSVSNLVTMEFSTNLATALESPSSFRFEPLSVWNFNRVVHLRDRVVGNHSSQGPAASEKRCIETLHHFTSCMDIALMQGFIAIRDGRDLGCLVMSQSSTRSKLYVSFLAIDPEVKSQGVGRAMLSHAIELAQKSGVRQIVTFCNTGDAMAVRTHLHMGFKYIDRSQVCVKFYR